MMKLKEFDITLDIKKSSQVPLYEVVVGDFDANCFNISLTDGGEPYPLEGLDVEIAFAKPDRTTVVQDESNGIVIEEDTIKCTLASNTIAVSGVVYAEVRVLQDTKVLTSTRFRFYVRQPILNDETVKSSNEYPMLVRALEDAKEAAEFLPEINAAVVDIRDAESDLNQSIRQATDLDDTLKGTIVLAGQSKDLLDGSIEDAGTAKTQLDGSISSAGTSKTELEGSITQAGTTKEQLDGSIAQAGTSKTGLDSSISTAEDIKSRLDDSIQTGDLVAFRDEFDSHLNDYATQADVILKNEIVNGDFSQGNANWVLHNSTLDTTQGIGIVTSTSSTYLINSAPNIPVGAKDTIYIKYNIKLSAAGQSFQIHLRADTYYGALWAPVLYITIENNVLNTNSHVVKGNSSVEAIRVVFRVGSTAAAGDTMELDNIVVVNLTKVFGAGNEPTKQEMDSLVSLVPNQWWDGELKPSQKLLLNWQLKLIRQNRNAIVALGGTIV